MSNRACFMCCTVAVHRHWLASRSLQFFVPSLRHPDADSTAFSLVRSSYCTAQQLEMRWVRLSVLGSWYMRPRMPIWIQQVQSLLGLLNSDEQNFFLGSEKKKKKKEHSVTTRPNKGSMHLGTKPCAYRTYCSLSCKLHHSRGREGRVHVVKGNCGLMQLCANTVPAWTRYLRSIVDVVCSLP